MKKIEIKSSDYDRMNIDDKIIVSNDFNLERERYPWYPDLAGKTGKIARIQTETDSGYELDEPIYWVKFEPFQVVVIPENENAYAFHPTEWVTKSHWTFSGSELLHE